MPHEGRKGDLQEEGSSQGKSGIGGRQCEQRVKAYMYRMLQ